MKSYVPYRKAGLLIPFNEVPHLWAIMNDECSAGLCLTIMITSIRAGKYYDPACVLNAGDHSFIQHPSYLLYRMAETLPANRISRLVSKNYYITKDDFDSVVFARIAEGIRKSEDTPLRIVRYANENGI